MTDVYNELAQDITLIQEFLVEWEELPQGMDQDMAALESAPQDSELLNRIFRAMHSVKGTSGFLGFDPVVRLSHRAEDVLNALRRGEAELNRRCIAALLIARLIRLAQLFQSQPSSGIADIAGDPARKVVILGVAEKRAALLVDELLGQESTVVKPLGHYLHRCSSLAGATISGKGRVRLVLDPAGLLAASQSMPAFGKASA
jgi:chemotaxis protein histidine kinase CheA